MLAAVQFAKFVVKAHRLFGEKTTLVLVMLCVGYQNAGTACAMQTKRNDQACDIVKLTICPYHYLPQMCRSSGKLPYTGFRFDCSSTSSVSVYSLWCQ